MAHTTNYRARKDAPRRRSEKKNVDSMLGRFDSLLHSAIDLDQAVVALLDLQQDNLPKHDPLASELSKTETLVLRNAELLREARRMVQHHRLDGMDTRRTRDKSDRC